MADTPPLAITIRPARPADLEALVELLRLLFAIEVDFTFDADKQRRGLALFFEHPTGRRLLVAEGPGGEVLGMASAQLLISTAEGSWKALVEDVVVAEAARGRGLGARLLHGLAEWAAGLGARRMDLLADRANAPALGFYEKQQWASTSLVALQKRL